MLTILSPGLGGEIEIANVTSNPGLLDSNLGKARIVDGHHVLTHYFDLTKITAQLNDLNETYQQTLQVIAQDVINLRNSESIVATLNATFQIVKTKLDDIRIPVFKTRPRRGLINGLGSVIKFITGNLDSDDEQRYNSIISHLQRDQEDIQSQISHQYSINEAVQANFNKTIEIINLNNQELREEINNWKSQSDLGILSQTRTQLDHHYMVLNLLLNAVQDIENSLVACRTNQLHPSVIDSHLLLQELDKLSKFYGNRFLNFQNQNLFEIQSYIKVTCFIGIDEIVYFLSIPIVDPRECTLHLVEPLPTSVNQEFLTIIPTAKYFLKSSDTIYPLTKNCPAGHLYLCPNYLISPTKFDCEVNFLLSGSTSECEFVKLVAEGNIAKLLLEINRYLLFFPLGDTVSIIHLDRVETKTLRGIYLISPGKQIITYKNQTLFAPHNELAGRPFIVTDLSLKITPQQKPNRELHLKDLELISLNLPKVKQIETFRLTSLATPSFWTILLYVVFIGLFSTTCYYYHRHVRDDHQPSQNCTP